MVEAVRVGASVLQCGLASASRAAADAADVVTREVVAVVDALEVVQVALELFERAGVGQLRVPLRVAGDAGGHGPVNVVRAVLICAGARDRRLARRADSADVVAREVVAVVDAVEVVQVALEVLGRARRSEARVPLRVAGDAGVHRPVHVVRAVLVRADARDRRLAAAAARAHVVARQEVAVVDALEVVQVALEVLEGGRPSGEERVPLRVADDAGVHRPVDVPEAVGVHAGAVRSRLAVGVGGRAGVAARQVGAVIDALEVEEVALEVLK